MTLRLPRSCFLLPLAGLAVCTGAATPGARPDPREAAFLRANDAAMERMMAAMQLRPTGSIDRDFAAMMIPHHQGGIDMARALLRYGSDERMKRLARAIVAKQGEEIALMRQLAGPTTRASPARPMAGPMRMPMPMATPTQG